MSLSEQIDAARNEIVRGRKLLLKEEIDAQDFRDIKGKRTIIGSIYPEKLIFGGFQYRTTRINVTVEALWRFFLNIESNSA